MIKSFITAVLVSTVVASPVWSAEKVGVAQINSSNADVQRCSALLLTTSKGEAVVGAIMDGTTSAASFLFEDFVTDMAIAVGNGAMAAVNPAYAGVVIAQQATDVIQGKGKIMAGIKGLADGYLSYESRIKQFKIFQLKQSDGTEIDFLIQEDADHRSHKTALKKIKKMIKASEKIQTGSTELKEHNPSSVFSRICSAAGCALAIAAPIVMHIYPDLEFTGEYLSSDWAEVGITAVSVFGGLQLRKFGKWLSPREADIFSQNVIQQVVDKNRGQRTVVVFSIAEYSDTYIEAIKAQPGVTEVQPQDYLAEVLAEEIKAKQLAEECKESLAEKIKRTFTFREESKKELAAQDHERKKPSLRARMRARWRNTDK